MDEVMHVKESRPGGHELAGIEILRFLCAFGVLIWHFQHFFFRGAWQPEVGTALRHALPLYRPLMLFYEYGNRAVPFFWVISGYIFYWHYAESVRTGAVSFGNYWLRRFSRLYPLHLATLIFVATAQYIYWRSHGVTFIYGSNTKGEFVAQLLFASNWLTGSPPSFNGPIWSVSIEVLIYLCFFGVARAFGSRATPAAIAAVAFVLGFPILRKVLDPQVFYCGVYFFAGGVAQRLASRKLALPAAAGAAIVTIALAALVHLPPAAAVLGRPLNDLAVLILATSLVIAMTKLGETTLHAPFGRLAFLGNATYSSYLIHFPLQLLTVIVIDRVGISRTIFYSPIALLVYLGVVVGAGLLVHRYFEMPAQDTIRRAVKSFVSGKPWLRQPA
jgi:peptidoglycan/LPS O-acetylase OafA/YrhL